MDIFGFHKLPLLLNQLCCSLSSPRSCHDLLLWLPSQPCTVCLPTIVARTPPAIFAKHCEECMIGKELSSHSQLIHTFDNNNTNYYSFFFLYCVFERLNGALQTQYIAEHKCIYKHVISIVCVQSK